MHIAIFKNIYTYIYHVGIMNKVEHVFENLHLGCIALPS